MQALDVLKQAQVRCYMNAFITTGAVFCLLVLFVSMNLT